MSNNILFEDLSNKQIAKVIDELKASKILGPKIKNFEMLSSGFSILKNLKTRAEIKKRLKNYNEKIESFIDYFDRNVESPSEIIKTKKEGIESIPKEIDALKRIESSDKLNILRGYIAKINALNQMLKKIYEEDEDTLNKTMSNVYNGEKIFNKEDGKSEKIISTSKHIIKLLQDIISKNLFSFFDINADKTQTLKRIKENISNAYTSLNDIEEKEKNLRYDLKMSKTNKFNRQKELEDKLNKLENQKNNINNWIKNPNIITQKIDLRKRKIDELKRIDKEKGRAESNPEIKYLEREIEELEYAKTDGGKKFLKGVQERIETYHRALKNVASKKSEWTSYNDFEKDIRENINNYFYYINSFIKIISKNDGEIVNKIKDKEELVDQLKREVTELEKYPMLSSISFEDKEEFEKLINLKKKLIDKLGESKKLINSPKLKEFEKENKKIQDGIKSFLSEKESFINKAAKEKGVTIQELTDKEINDVIKQARKENFPEGFNIKNFDENFFRKYYWKIFYTDRNVFNYLRNIFGDEETEERNRKLKNEIVKSEKYQDIKEYLGKEDAKNYLQTMLTLDSYFKDNKKYSEYSAEALYKAAKEMKNYELAKEVKTALDLENSAKEEKEGDRGEERELIKNYKKRQRQLDKEIPKDDDVEFSKQDKKPSVFNRKYKYTNSFNNTWTKEDEERYQKMLTKKPESKKSNEEALFDKINKYKKELPYLYKVASFIVKPNNDIEGLRVEWKQAENEMSSLTKEISELNKQIEEIDKINTDHKKEDTVPEIKDIKELSNENLKNIKSNFNKLFKFTKKYINHIYEKSYPSLELNVLNPKSKAVEDSSKRDVKKEFKIKKGLISIIKSIFKDDSETYKKLIKEVQKQVEPYQPKTIGRNKIGKIKERQDFKFEDVLNIFKFIKDAINDKESYSDVVSKNEQISKNNKKADNFDKERGKLYKRTEELEEKLKLYHELKKIIKEKKINIGEEKIKAAKKVTTSVPKDELNLPDSKVERGVEKFLKDLKG